MEYNKLHVRKFNDHKILHKVRKHWVVVSMALLGAIGATGIAKNQVNANQTNYNNQSNHSASVNATNLQSKNSLILNQNHQSQSNRQSLIHKNSFKGYVNSQASDIHNRILAQINQTRLQATPIKDFRSVTAVARKPKVSVNGVQVRDAIAKARHNINAIKNVKHNLLKMDTEQVRPLRVGDEEGGDLSSVESNEISDITSEYNQMSGITSTVDSYANDENIKSASNSANAELNRYGGVIDSNASGSSFVSSIDSLVDSSNAAAGYERQLNNDISNIPVGSAVDANINLKFANQMAESLYNNVTNSTTAQEYSNEIASLSINAKQLYNTANNYINAASNASGDIIAQASKVGSVFSTVSASADSMGAALNHWNQSIADPALPDGGNPADMVALYNAGSGSYLPHYAVANVYNGVELNAATFDPYVHQINLMNNVDLWGVDVNGTIFQDNANSGNVVVSNNPDIGIPERNLTVNGLNNSGHWNTMDLAGANYNLAYSTSWGILNNYNNANLNNQNYTVTSTLKNLHAYDTNYYGIYTINAAGTPLYCHGKTVYDNMTFDGSQLGYNNLAMNAGGNGKLGTSAEFKGKVVISTGSYSPNGRNLTKNPKSLHKYTYVNDQGKTVPTGYDYDTGGIPAHPFDGDDGPLGAESSQAGGSGPINPNSIDAPSNQQILQIQMPVIFDRDCQFNGYTSNGNCLELDGKGEVDLQPNSKVSLHPGGNWAETVDKQNLPTGVYIEGTGQLNVGAGATLDIDPRVDVGKYSALGGTDSGNLAPAAIYSGNSGKVTVANGGVLSINYPDINKYHPSDNPNKYYSLPDSSSSVGGPIGVITMLNKSSINAMPYSKILVNGGNPGNAINDNGNGSWGSLVAYGTPNSTGSHGNVNAYHDSTVKLTVGGSQPVILFDSPEGTPISVTDPKIFKLDLSKNYLSEGHSLVASGGVGIQGTNVDAIDGNGHDFGQFNNVTLPGGMGAFKSKDGNDTPGAENMIPYAKTNLGTADSNENEKVFDDSIGLINPSHLTGNEGDDGSFWYQLPAFGAGIIAQIPINTVDGHHGWNISKGFTFKGVPHTNVEGVRIQNGVVSGYAIPGSYIRLNEGNDNNNNPATPSKPVYGSQTYDDRQSYDPGDHYQYPSTYIAIAGNDGYWSYKLPNKNSFDNSSIDQSKLVATAHTQTVAVDNAARRITDYETGHHKIPNYNNQAGVDNSLNYYHTKSNFPNGTYSTANDEDPSGNENDPTETDDDDYGNSDINGTVTYVHHNDDTDDTNAGQYFWSGRLYGIRNKENMVTDNSVYAMPYPFIVGYLTARGEKLDPNSINNNIKEIRKRINDIINRDLLHNYLPHIQSDGNRADQSLADIDDTISYLDSLAYTAKDQYLNLESLASSLTPSGVSANDYEYSNFNYEGSNYNSPNSLNNNALYSDVYNINYLLTGMYNTLGDYENDVDNDANQYSGYYTDASLAAQRDNSAGKEFDLLNASALSDQVNDYNSSAYVDSSSASSDDQIASSYANDADSDSNSVNNYTEPIRTNASNAEAPDFSSVARSYSDSASVDSNEIDRYSTEISHRDRQMSVANGIYEQQEDQMDIINNSLENYLPVLDSLNNLSLSGSLGSDYSADYSAVNNALQSLQALEANAATNESSDENNSATGNQDSSDASSVSVDEKYQSDVLSQESMFINGDNSAQSSDIDLAQSNNAEYDEKEFNSARDVNETANQSLNDVGDQDDSLAHYDESLASSAWAQIHALHDKVTREEAMEAPLMTLTADASHYGQVLGSANAMSNSQDSSSSTRPASSSSALAAKMYRGTYQVTVQDENQQGQPTSRDVETIPIDKPIGTILTVNPQIYQPVGFHAVNGDRPVGVQVTGQGVKPGNVTLYYMVDHENSGSNSASNNSSSANDRSNSSNRASVSSSANHQPFNPIRPNSNQNSNVENSSFNPNNNNEASSASDRAGSNSANTINNRVNSSNNRLNTSSDSAKSKSAAAAADHVHHEESSDESAPQDYGQADQVDRSYQDRNSAEPRKTAPASQGDSTISSHLGSRSGDHRYAQGVNDARLGSVSASADPAYQSGYQNYERGSQQLPQTEDGSTVSLVAAMLIAASGAMMSYLADRRRHDE